MEHTYCSPFVIGKNGRNFIHTLARQTKQSGLLSLLLSQNRHYSFWVPSNPGIKFSWCNSVTLGELETGDTALHLAVIMHDGDSFKVLLNACQNDITRVDGPNTDLKDIILKNELMILDMVNNRGWNVTDLSVSPKADEESIRQF
jgi:hypothetical protein